MATETLFPNSGGAGWDSGTWDSVNEGVDTPNDADLVGITGTSKEGTTNDFGMVDSALVNADTVTDVNIRIRAQNNAGAGNDFVGVDLLIGGTPTGTQQSTGTLTGSWANYTLSSTDWDTDWTASQLDGIGVRLTSGQAGMPVSLETEVSEVEIVITYTPAPGGPNKAVFGHHQDRIMF